MKAIITRERRNTLDTTINWMMGIRTEVRKPTTEEIKNKKSKKSPYNLFDYTAAIGSSAAVVITNVIHPDVLLANSVHYLSKRHLEKRLNKFNKVIICEDGNINEELVEEDPVEDDAHVVLVEGEIINHNPASTSA